MGALAAGPVAAQTCVDPPAGMVGWWPGDGDSLDVHSGLHGVAVNGTSYAPGLVGEAFLLDGMAAGQNDRVDLPPSALAGLTDVTVEMWVQTSDAEGAIFSGSSPDPAAGGNELLLYQGTTGLQQVVKTTSSRALPANINDGSWHHLAFVRSGTTGMLYVDGARIDARAFPAGPFNVGPGGLLLGQEQDCLGGCFEPPSQAYDGLIDEVSIYSRALSDSEIVALRDAGAAGKCKPASRAELLAMIDELETELDSLDAELVASNALVETLTAHIGALDAYIANQNTQISGLLARIQELESQEPPVCEEPPVCPAPPVCEDDDDMDHDWPHYWKYQQWREQYLKWLESKRHDRDGRNGGNHWH